MSSKKEKKRPYTKKRLLQFSNEVLTGQNQPNDSRLRSQNKIDYYEKSSSSQINEDEEIKPQFLNKKTYRDDNIEYNPYNDIRINPSSKPERRQTQKHTSSKSKKKITKRLKYTKCSKTKESMSDKEEPSEKSYKIPKDYKNEYSLEYGNIPIDEKAREKIFETIVTASKYIKKYEKESLIQEKENEKRKSGYPEDCIPINADVTTFDFQALIDKQLDLTSQLFDVVLVDPPWPLSSANPQRGVVIKFNTLNDDQIHDMKNIEKLQDNGFIFIWTINARFDFVFQILSKWGYKYCDMINWIKATRNGRYAKGHGYYLQHTKETCIVGVKGNVEFTNDISNSDLIFSQRRGQSQKPNELYEKIERLIPNGYYLELFGRRNNLRDNWITIGNEI